MGRWSTFGLGLGMGVVAGAWLRGARDRGRIARWEPQAPVEGIGGVFLRARDPDALRRWYRTALGFPSHAEGSPAGTSHDFRWRAVDREGVAHTVWSAFGPDDRHLGAPDRAFMINYRVRDLEDVLVRLADAGIALDQGPETWDNGRARAGHGLLGTSPGAVQRRRGRGASHGTRGGRLHRQVEPTTRPRPGPRSRRGYPEPLPRRVWLRGARGLGDLASLAGRPRAGA